MFDLADKSVVVVGGAAGIGLECATIAGRLGGMVTVADVSPDADEVAGAIRDAGGTADAVFCDALSANSVDDMVKVVTAAHGGVDALITTVGGEPFRWKASGSGGRPVVETDLEDFEREVRLHLVGTFIVCRGVLPTMLAAGAGAIVTTSSTLGADPAPGKSAYSAAKAGIIAFTRALAAEVGPRGVRANVLAPGPTTSAVFLESVPPEGIAKFTEESFLRQLSAPEDAAAVALFLVSDAARMVNAQVLHVHGGRHGA